MSGCQACYTLIQDRLCRTQLLRVCTAGADWCVTWTLSQASDSHLFERVCDSPEGLSVVFAQPLEHDCASRSVHTHGKGLGAEEELDNPSAEKHLDDLLHDRQQTCRKMTTRLLRAWKLTCKLILSPFVCHVLADAAGNISRANLSKKATSMICCKRSRWAHITGFVTQLCGIVSW